MLVRGGHVVPGFGTFALSAPPSTFAQASTDLQNQVVAVVTAGNTYYDENASEKTLDFTDAVEAYMAAGQAGATSLGPEIDSAGAQAITSSLTHQAWSLNAQLAALTKSGLPDPKNGITAAYFNQSDADKAKAVVTQMIALYDQAISQGSAAVGQPVSTPSSPTVVPTLPAPVTPAPSYLPVAALGAVAIAAAVVVVRRSPRRSHA